MSHAQDWHQKKTSLGNTDHQSAKEDVNGFLDFRVTRVVGQLTVQEHANAADGQTPENIGSTVYSQAGRTKLQHHRPTTTHTSVGHHGEQPTSCMDKEPEPSRGVRS